MSEVRAEEYETCPLRGAVIYCQCGKPSSHYGTMGVRGAREVREGPPPKTKSGAVRYVLYRCPGCRKQITRTIGKTGEFRRAMRKQQSFCATSGKPETITKIREVSP